MKMQKQSGQASERGTGLAVAPRALEQSDLERVIRYAEAGEFESALEILRKPTLDAALRNALGVCNLRMGRPEEAVRVFRDLVLVPGGGWNKPHTLPIYKTNFATALLMTGHPCGAKELLGDVGDESHPSVKRLRQAMAAWERTLSLWQWLNWKMFLLEPRNQTVPLDFTPGDFLDADAQMSD